MSEQDHARLLSEAHSQGLTMQQLFELRMLDYSQPVPMMQPRKPRPRQDEELPLTG